MRKFIIVFSIILLTSCATKQAMLKEPVIIEHVTHDTLKKTRFVNTSDTVYVRDSIAPNDRGGTDRWHTEWHGSKRTTTDTVYIHHTDTIPKPIYITKTVTVREKVGWWENIKSTLSFILYLLPFIVLIPLFPILKRLFLSITSSKRA